MIRWSHIIDAISREWCDFFDRHDKRRERDETLAAKAESDKRHLTYIWDGRNNTTTKGQDQ